MLSFRSKVDAGFSVTIGVNKPYPPSREDQFTSALAKLRQWSMRWSVGWSRSLRFIPAVRPGIGGAITSDAGNRLEDSSRSRRSLLAQSEIRPGNERRRSIRQDT